jgi:hypothetical protein
LSGLFHHVAVILTPAIEKGMKKYKQVVVMRTDLDMPVGKMVAQGAHASIGALLKSGISRCNSKGTRIGIEFNPSDLSPSLALALLMS